MISKDTIDRIFDTVRIDEVVGDFVTLKRRGANFLGNCPFHNEKTPSFTVSPAKGIFKCFGCGKGGNSVNFIMELEQYSYTEALRYLAKKYNIEIEDGPETPEQAEQKSDRESLLALNSFAQKHFSDILYTNPTGKAIALAYLKERGIRDDIIAKFQLGFCLDEWSNFTDAALKNGYLLKYLSGSGLTIEKDENKRFDRFKGRVMFPIHNVAGRVIGFGGRVMVNDKKAAKYINSPESEVYNKSKELYGLFFAKKQIMVEDNCFLVEGYLDVISLFQSGIENVVASSGTSLTIEQIRRIRQYTHNITILYDGDSAGIKASFRGIDLILEEGMNVRVLTFPEGDDPDSYAKKVSASELKEFIHKNTKDFITFKVSHLIAEVGNDPIKKAELIKEIIISIAIISDSIKRQVYVKECSEIMQIDEQILHFELNKLLRKKLTTSKDRVEDIVPETEEETQAAVKQVAQQSTTIESDYQERNVIRLMICYGNCELILQKIITEEEADEEEYQSPFKPKEEEEIITTVAEFIIHELNNEQYKFNNNTYQEIYELYSETLLKQEFPTENMFINHPNTEISSLTINFLSNPYTLLPSWESRKIYVTTEEMILKQSVMDAIFSVLSKKVEILISEVNKRLKIAYTNGEDYTELMKDLIFLNDAKKNVSEKLGRIILK